MSRKNIILLVSLLVLVALSAAIYLYIENKNLTENTAQKAAEQQLSPQEVMNELNNLKSSSTGTKSSQDVVKELNSLNTPVSTSTPKTPSSSTTTKSTGVATPPTPPKTGTKTQEAVLQELNSLSTSSNSASDTLNSLNNLKP